MMQNHAIYYPLYENKDKFIILVTGGRGCEDPDTPIMMADLTIKPIKDIVVGDKVMGDDGTPRNVLDTVRGRSMMYKVHQKNAEDYIVNDNHILTMYHNGQEVDIHIMELLLRGTDEYYGITIPFDGTQDVIYSRISIEQLGEGDYCGIMLDGNQRYLHADGTVTHNSGKSTALSNFITRLTFELGEDKNGKQVSHQILYSRYTMTSAKTSIIPEVEDKIRADGLGKYFGRSGADIVNVMTGSHIMFRGIKTSSGNQTAKLKSIKGLSVFVCDEAEEFVNENDFETIMYSIRQQGLKNLVIIIMNPSDSNHFIYQRYIKDTHKLVDYDGTMVQISTHPNVLHIHTSYLDNEKYLADTFLAEAKAMKEKDPERYGHIFMGRWADVAEGAIFKKWGVVKEFPAYAKKVALAMDLGYTQDPTAILKCGVVDNALYIDEITYETGMLSAAIIKTLKENNENGSLFTYSESADPRLIDEIALGGVVIYPVSKGAGSILAGIDKMLTMDIFITERSVNTQYEFRNYTWAKDKFGKYINQPEGGMDHCFTGDTLILTNYGEKPISEVKIGDMVINSDGSHKVLKVFENGIKDVVTATLVVNGITYTLNATDNHKIKTTQGWKQLKDIKAGDVIFQYNTSTGKNIICIKENIISREVQTGCTKMYGVSTMEKYLKGVIFIIKTTILTITTSQTWNALTHMSIYGNILFYAKKMSKNLQKCVQTWTMRVYSQMSGMALKKGGNGTVCMVERFFKNSRRSPVTALCAEKNIKDTQTAQHQNSALTTASPNIGVISSLILKHECVQSVERSSQVTNTSHNDFAVEGVVESIVLTNVRKEMVYDLYVDGTHEYFANGILVHNCIDAVRYFVLAVLLGKVMKPVNTTKERLGIF